MGFLIEADGVFEQVFKDAFLCVKKRCLDLLFFLPVALQVVAAQGLELLQFVTVAEDTVAALFFHFGQFDQRIGNNEFELQVGQWLYAAIGFGVVYLGIDNQGKEAT